MFHLVKLSHLYINLGALCEAEKLAESPGQVALTLRSGRVRVLSIEDSLIVLQALDWLAENVPPNESPPFADEGEDGGSGPTLSPAAPGG